MSNLAAQKLESLESHPERLSALGQVETLRLAIDLLGEGYSFFEAQSIATGIVESYPPEKAVGIGEDLLSLHVIPHPRGWALLHPGRPKISVIMSQFEETVQLGRKYALDAETSLVIHDPSGNVREVTFALRDY